MTPPFNPNSELTIGKLLCSSCGKPIIETEELFNDFPANIRKVKLLISKHQCFEKTNIPTPSLN